MKLTTEERKILEGLEVTGLRFLARISEDKDFESFRKIINHLIDVEKNIVFGLTEDDKLKTEHAFARGKVAGHIQTAKIIMGARGEIERRNKKREEMKRNG